MAILPLVSQTDLEEKTMAINVQTTNLNTSLYDPGMGHLLRVISPYLYLCYNLTIKGKHNTNNYIKNGS